MKQIRLPNKKVVLVDDDDFDFLLQFGWHSGGTYATAWVSPTKKLFMHRMILGVSQGKYVDHINGDPLDNRKRNLRICSHAENLRNRHHRGSGSSKFRGVSWIKANKCWRAAIIKDYKTIHIGCFKSEEAAARAYDDKAKELFGEFASPNTY